MRKITIDNASIKELIAQKGKIVEEGREINKKIEELQEDLNRCGLQINKLNDQIIPLVKGLEIEMGEFEEIESVKIEEGELIMTIFDKIEEFKEALRKAKEDSLKKEENIQTNPQ